MTYWEVMGRARAGRRRGGVAAAAALRASRQETSWAGDNAANINGDLKDCDGEPYLADMIVVPAAVVQGVLGIQPSWDRLEVHPCMPAGWQRAEADVLYRGRRHHVTVDRGRVEIRPLERVLTCRRRGRWTSTCKTPPDGPAVTTNWSSPGIMAAPAAEEAVRRRRRGGPMEARRDCGVRRDASPHAPRRRADDAGHHPRPARAIAPEASATASTGRRRSPSTRTRTFASARTRVSRSSVGFAPRRTACMRMISKSGYPAFEVYGYGLYVQDGVLEAWLDDAHAAPRYRPRQPQNQRRQVAPRGGGRQPPRQSGSRSISTARLDTQDGSPGPKNPVDTSAVGPAQARCSLDARPGFRGLLDEVSIFRGAHCCRRSSTSSTIIRRPLESLTCATRPRGSYQSPPHDWQVPVTVAELTTAATCTAAGPRPPSTRSTTVSTRCGRRPR